MIQLKLVREVVFFVCGDLPVAPVQERSILLPSVAIPWDGRPFRREQRRQRDRAHRLWTKFATIVILTEEVQWEIRR